MSAEPVAEAPKPPPLAPASASAATPAPKMILVNIRDKRQRCVVCRESLDRGAMIQFTKKPVDRKLWLVAMSRSRQEYIVLKAKLEATPRTSQVLCRLHFKPEDFSTDGRNRLRFGRIPSRLVWRPSPASVARPFSNRLDRTGNPLGFRPPSEKMECNAVDLMKATDSGKVSVKEESPDPEETAAPGPENGRMETEAVDLMKATDSGKVSVKEELPDPEETAAAGPENGRMETETGWQSPGSSLDSFASDLDSFEPDSQENVPETGYIPAKSGRQAAPISDSPETSGRQVELYRDRPEISGRQAALIRDSPATSGNPEKRTFFMVEDHCLKQLLKTCPQCAAVCQVTMVPMGTGVRANRVCPNGDVIPPWFSSRSVVVKQKEDIKMET